MAGVQEIPAQSYIVYLQAMEANGDSGLGVGVKCVAPGVHLNEIFFFIIIFLIGGKGPGRKLDYNKGHGAQVASSLQGHQHAHPLD